MPYTFSAHLYGVQHVGSSGIITKVRYSWYLRYPWGLTLTNKRVFIFLHNIYIDNESYPKI